MPLEMGLWRANGGKLDRIAPTGLAYEAELENYLESDPSLLGEPLLIIGRQVVTGFGGFIDLLALDETGAVHVIELKRDKTPRDVTAQVLDYGSWVASLGRAELQLLFRNYSGGKALEEAFAECFNETLPEEVNATQVFTIVASSIDAATERIVRFLNEGFGVPVNVVFFRHFVADEAAYLARAWLIEGESQAPGKGVRSSSRGKNRESWNGADWYVAFGDDPNGRSWEDARRLGFVSGGGAKWFSRTLKNLPMGARVFVHLPGRGYVGVGTVTGEARRFDEAVVDLNGVASLLREQVLEGDYKRDDDHHDDMAEWVVPIEWQHAEPRERAFWKNGMYANQNTATRLRQQFTIDEVSAHFGLDD